MDWARKNQKKKILPSLMHHIGPKIQFEAQIFGKNLEKGWFAKKRTGSKWTGLFSSKWTGLKSVKFLERKNYRSDFGRKSSERTEMISVKFENLEEMSKWNRLFSVNGLGFHFCGIFEEEKNYRSDFGKNFFGKKQWH